MISSIAVVLILIAVSWYRIRRRNSLLLPKGYTAKSNIAYPLPEDLTRDRFLLKKLPEKIDVIIIGSGISGLSAGECYRKLEKKY